MLSFVRHRSLVATSSKRYFSTQLNAEGFLVKRWIQVFQRLQREYRYPMARYLNTQSLGYYVRTIREDDVKQILDMRREMEIHESESSIRTWMQIDAEGYKVAVTEDEKVIGTCSAVKNNENLYFTGNFVVKEEHQNKGVGSKLWKSCEKHFGNKNLALNAVPTAIDLYKLHKGVEIIEKDFTCHEYATQKSADPNKLSNELPSSCRIKPYKDDYLPSVIEYDQKLMGFPRNLLMKLSFKEENSNTFIAFKNDLCIGYGTIRRTCLGSGRVGPLYADNERVAEVLLQRLMESMPDVNSIIMVQLTSNPLSIDLSEKLGCDFQFETTRMYSKEKILVDAGRIFALYNVNFSVY